MTHSSEAAPASGVERNGINPVPEAQRRGSPRELFAGVIFWHDIRRF